MAYIHAFIVILNIAFGSPIGGVLFSLEEAASFFNPNLILRTLVASIISSFTLNLVLTIYHGLKTFSYPGLFNLGQFEALPYAYYEIPIFMFMGCVGGVLGAFWTYANTKISIFRQRFDQIIISFNFSDTNIIHQNDIQTLYRFHLSVIFAQ